MKKGLRHNIRLFYVWLGLSICTLGHGFAQQTTTQAAPNDTLPKSRYPISKTVPQEYKELTRQSPADLRDPENLKTSVEYDLHTGMYIIRTLM